MITHIEPDILKCEVKWVLGSFTTNKASGCDGIPVGLFQTLKYDAVTVLHSVYPQILKTQQWPQDWKRSVFIPIPKKSSDKECSNYHTIALILRLAKVKVLVAQSRPALCDPMDCSLPGSSVHGILQARILEWVAVPFSRASSQPRDRVRSPALPADSLPSEPPVKPAQNSPGQCSKGCEL